MKKPIIHLIISFLFVLPAQSQKGEFLQTEGTKVVAPDGSSIHLRGINLGNWLVPEGYMFKLEGPSSPRMIERVISELVGPNEARSFWKKYRDNYITKDDIHFIRELGFNSVRVPFDFRLFVSEDYPGIYCGPGFELLDSVISWCKEENLWVILDMHCAPGGQTGDNIDNSFGGAYLFDGEESQQQTIDLWQKLAERYKDEPIVIGYDLLNEPIAHFLETDRLNPKLEPLYKRIVAAIRQVDVHHLIFLGGAQWNSNFGVFGPPFDSKLVYTFHKYWTDTTQSVIQDYIDFGKRHSVPIWMGESGENTDQWIASFRRLLDINNIGWCFWPYKKMDATSNVVTFNRPEMWDSVVAFAKGCRNSYDDIRKTRLSPDVSRKVLQEFLELSRFSNCRVNEGYVRALGLRP